jgi:hypothetical protein
MRRKTVFLTMLSALFLFACQPPVTFDKPQPDNVPALSHFSGRLQGEYISEQDNSNLIVTENTLIRIYDFDLKTHVSLLDSSMQLIGDSLFDLETNEGIPVRIEGDSIVQHIYETDTLFAINQENVLKKFKGYYFVNILSKDNTWRVQKLEMSKGKLVLSSINNREDLDQLKAITETTQDTVPYIFSPAKRQFKDFVRNEGFRNKETFLKVRE